MTLLAGSSTPIRAASPNSDLFRLNDPNAPVDWHDFSTLKTITCVNHPTAVYLSKNPWARSLHFIKACKEAEAIIGMDARGEAGFTGPANLECPCPFSDLRVIGNAD